MIRLRQVPKLPFAVAITVLFILGGSAYVDISESKSVEPLPAPVESEHVPEPSSPILESPMEMWTLPSPIVNNFVKGVKDGVEQEIVTPAYTEEELEILAIIIYQEAGGDACSDECRRKVGSVFLNRVKSSIYPDTFEEVATQYKQYGALFWTGIKWPDRASNPGEAHAVKRAYRIAEELLLNGSILPENVLFQAEFPQGDGTYSYEDTIYFCYLGVIE